MVAIEVSNRWCLRKEEYEHLQAMGKVTKLNWWCKNMGSNQFVDYDKQIGARVRGDIPFNQVLNLDPGEYMFGTGDYGTELNGRHCSQVFYLYVAEDGTGGVCKKFELPSNGGSGPSEGASTQPSGFSPFGGATQSNFGVSSAGNGGWANPTTVEKKDEYFIFPSYMGCMNDMTCNGESFCCDAVDPKDMGETPCCKNCVNGVELFIKKE